MRERKYLIKLVFTSIWFIFVFNLYSIVKNKHLSLERISNYHNQNVEALSSPKEVPVHLQEKLPKEEKPWKKIAFATHFWSKSNMWKKVFKRQLMNECEEKRCNVIFDKESVNLADAVIFNGNDLHQKWKFNGFKMSPTWHRRPEQRYIFFTLEAPPTLSNVLLERYNNFFNWTMTYRTDSDVFMPYGKTFKRNEKKTVNYVTQEELKQKKMAVWMVSHCETQSKREDFVKKLSRFIPVETFGLCGEKKCGNRTTIPRVDKFGDEQCEMVMQNYSFYLALENSLCDDYVTEKLYRSLKLGVIPVVLGGVNYTSFAPPESFIDARNFTSVADLAKYLERVSADSQLYNRYLRWQEYYDIELGSPYKPFVCDLCKKLHEQKTNMVYKSYPSIKDWFSEEKTCISPSFF